MKVDALMALKIAMDEGLRAYAKRYYEVFNRIPECNQEVAVVSFKHDLKDDCPLRKFLAKTLPKSMEALMARIEKYARAEKDASGNKETKQEKGNGSPKRSRGNNGPTKQEIGQRTTQTVTTVFRIPIHKVLDQIRNQPYFRTPAKAPRDFMGRRLGRHCAYHNENGHMT